MFSRITIRQAQLNTEQAQRSVEIAMLTRVDTKATLDQGRSMKRLSLVAGLFLPASTIAVSIQCLDTYGDTLISS